MNLLILYIYLFTCKLALFFSSIVCSCFYSALCCCRILVICFFYPPIPIILGNSGLQPTLDADASIWYGPLIEIVLGSMLIIVFFSHALIACWPELIYSHANCLPNSTNFNWNSGTIWFSINIVNRSFS